MFSSAIKDKLEKNLSTKQNITRNFADRLMFINSSTHILEQAEKDKVLISIMNPEDEKVICTFESDKKKLGKVETPQYPSKTAVVTHDNKITHILVGNVFGLTAYPAGYQQGSPIESPVPVPIIPQLIEAFKKQNRIVKSWVENQHSKNAEEVYIYSNIEDIKVLGDNKHFVTVAHHSFIFRGSYTDGISMATLSLWSLEGNIITHLKSEKCGFSRRIFAINSQQILDLDHESSSRGVIKVHVKNNDFNGESVFSFQYPIITHANPHVHIIKMFADQKHFLTSGQPRLLMWNTNNADPVMFFKCESTIRNMFICSDDEHFVTVSYQGKFLLTIWNKNSPDAVTEFNIEGADPNSVHLTSGGELIYYKKNQSTHVLERCVYDISQWIKTPTRAQAITECNVVMQDISGLSDLILNYIYSRNAKLTVFGGKPAIADNASSASNCDNPLYIAKVL
jgi:hypothetical protein